MNHSTSILSQRVSTESSQDFVVWKNEDYCGMIYGVICGVINGVFVFFVLCVRCSNINTYLSCVLRYKENKED